MTEDNTPPESNSPNSELAATPWLLKWPWWGWVKFLLGLLFVAIGGGDLIVTIVTVWPDLQQYAFNVVMLAFLPALTLAITATMLGQKATAQDSVWAKRGIVAFAIGFGMTILNLTIPAVHNARQAANEVTDRQWTEVAVGKENLIVSTPTSWEIKPHPELPSHFYMVHQRLDLHLTIFVVPKVDVAVTSLAEFQQSFVAELQQTLSNATVSSHEHREAGLLKAIDSEIVGTFQTDTRMSFRLRHMEFSEFWVDARLWGLPSRMAEHHETVERILLSIRLAE